MCLVLVGSSGFADDLDVAGAKSRYDAQQAIADQAQAVLQQAQSRLQILQGQLASAQQAADSDSAAVNAMQATLSNLDSQTSNLQADESSFQSQITNAENSLFIAQNTLQTAQRDAQRAHQQASELTNEVQQLQDNLTALEAQTPPPTSQIASVQAELTARQQELATANNQVQSLDFQVNSDESQVSQWNSTIANDQQRVTNDQNEVTALNNSRSQDLIELNADENNLTAAKSNVTTVTNEVQLQQSDTNNDQNAYNSQESQAQQLYAYYQQVLANYNRALAAVYAGADQSANSDAAHEASDRAPTSGVTDGQATGTAAGQSKGTADGTTRDQIVGYNDGRANGPSSIALAPSYAAGKGEGASDASTYAHAKSYPAGYNDALASTLALAPTNNATVDITSSLPTDPGTNSPEVSTNNMAIGPANPPAHPLPSAITPVPPPYNPPIVSIPAADKRYANSGPPCSNLVLPAFVPLCTTRYLSSYVSSFASQYSADYLQAFAPAFTASANASYQQAYGVANQGAYAAAQVQGAHDQGELDGYAMSLAAAQSAAYQAGQSDAAKTFAAGHLLVVRSVELVPTDASGLLVPAAYGQIRVTVDNYGGQENLLSALRVNVQASTNAASVTLPIRDLPAFAAYTRTVLVGVTRLSPQLLAPGTEVSASGVVESKQTDGSYATLSSFLATGTIHYPLEVTSLAFSGAPAIGKSETATFSFVNRTSAATPATAATLSVDPGEVTFAAGGAIAIPALLPGATGTVTTTLTPTDLVGDNTAVPFLLSTKTPDAKAWFDELLPTLVPVTRDAALQLYDESGQVVPSGILDVAAGDTVWFNVRFAFKATVPKNGPFTITATSVSDPGLTSADGSTVGEDLGSWEPGTTQDDMQIGLNVSQALKGKKVWIDVVLTEAGTTIHDLRVYFNVH